LYISATDAVEDAMDPCHSRVAYNDAPPAIARANIQDVIYSNDALRFPVTLHGMVPPAMQHEQPDSHDFSSTLQSLQTHLIR
jgi:hypothetical protein